MTRWKHGVLLASACTLVGVVCFVAGRATAPAPPALQAETRQASKAAATSTAQVDAVTAATSASTAAVVDRGKVTTTRRRFAAAQPPPPKPGCPACPACFEEETVVEQKDETRAATATSSARSATNSAATLATEQETFQASRVVVAAPALPRWSLGAMLGLDLAGNRMWGGQASVRVVGGLGVGAWALPSARAGGVLVEIRW